MPTTPAAAPARTLEEIHREINELPNVDILLWSPDERARLHALQLEAAPLRMAAKRAARERIAAKRARRMP